MKAITPHYIDGKIVEPHGREVMDSIKPTNNIVIGRVTVADEEDAKASNCLCETCVCQFWWHVKGERAAVLRGRSRIWSIRNRGFS
jgi:aldehyde dehydrogenase (NAD+)